MQPCLQIKLVIFKMHPSSQDFTRISPQKTHLWPLAVGPHSSETLTVEITGKTRDDGGRPPTSSRGSRVHTADTINLNIVQRNHKGVKSFYYFIILNTREPHLWNYRVIDIDVGEGSQQVLSARVRVKWYVEHRTRSRMATQHITTEHRGHRTQIWDHGTPGPGLAGLQTQLLTIVTISQIVRNFRLQYYITLHGPDHQLNIPYIHNIESWMFQLDDNQPAPKYCAHLIFVSQSS